MTRQEGCENRTSTEGKICYPLGYFWTHGYKVDVGHNSWTFRTARYNKNRNKTATRGDTTGGLLEGEKI